MPEIGTQQQPGAAAAVPSRRDGTAREQTEVRGLGSIGAEVGTLAGALQHIGGVAAHQHGAAGFKNVVVVEHEAVRAVGRAQVSRHLSVSSHWSSKSSLKTRTVSE